PSANGLFFGGNLARVCGKMSQERSCKAGAGLPILIQHLKIGSPTRHQRWCASSWRETAREKPEGARGTPTPFPNVGQSRGLVRPSGALHLKGFALDIPSGYGIQKKLE